MIGRGAIGRPTIFYEIKRDLGWTKQAPPWGEDNTAVARLWCWNRYLELSSELYEDDMCKNLKRHAVSFTKGLPGASKMRVSLHGISDQKELGSRVAEYLENLVESS
jgi:tRNA-dihydrouridine synthase